MLIDSHNIVKARLMNTLVQTHQAQKSCPLKECSEKVCSPFLPCLDYMFVQHYSMIIVVVLTVLYITDTSDLKINTHKINIDFHGIVYI